MKEEEFVISMYRTKLHKGRLLKNYKIMNPVSLVGVEIYPFNDCNKS